MPHFTMIGDLDANVVMSLSNFVDQTRQTPPDTKEKFIVRINSTGGSISNAIAMYNILLSAKRDVRTHNIGEVSSAANIVFLAGARRYACKHSIFRHHGSFWNMSGNAHRVMYEDALFGLQAAEKVMTDIFVQHTKLKTADVEQLFRSPVAMNPDEALKTGIIHAIQELD